MDRFETSAKTGANVEKAVNFLVAEILQNDKANQDRDASTQSTNKVEVGGSASAEGVRRIRVLVTTCALHTISFCVRCMCTGLRLLINMEAAVEGSNRKGGTE